MPIDANSFAMSTDLIVPASACRLVDDRQIPMIAQAEIAIDNPNAASVAANHAFSDRSLW